MKSNQLVTAVKTLLAIVILTLAFSIGAHAGQAAPEAQTSTKLNTSFQATVETQLVATQTVQYVDRPVTEVRYVERVSRVAVELGNFTDLAELKQWLEGSKQVTTVHFQSPDAVVDCDDYALELQFKALADGYLMSFQIIEPAQYNALFESGQLPLNALHAINLVLIGNTAYYIEPQTDEVVFAARLD